MARLPQGVRKRKDGLLEKRITVNKVRYSIYANNTKELTEKEQELREQIKEGAYIKNRSITLDKYFEKWLENRKGHNKSNTLLTYRLIYNKHIKEPLGGRKVAEIERREVQELQRKLSQTLNPTSINYVMSVLNIILNDAIRDEIITRNPAYKIKSIKQTEKATETYHRALTEEEQNIFMQTLKGSYYYNATALMLCTGLRCGEVAALQWGDIDFKSNVIHITKTVTKNENGSLAIGPPKTTAGKRDIPLTDNTKKIFEKQKQNNDKLLQFPGNYIFPSINGNILAATQINAEIKRTLKKLAEKGTEIEPFTSHALRDTFATRYIEQGGSPQTLKTILGHTSLAMTMDLYAHVLPNTKQAEMDKLIINI